MPRIYIDETAERSRNKSRREKRAHSRLNTLLHPEMERLELRITPAVRTWSGAIDNIWSNAGNWDVLPVAGDDLIFPAGASRFTTVSNFSPGTTFGSITIEDAGYAIFGNSVVLTNGVTSTHTTGTSVISNDMTLTNGSASVATGGRLELEGTISGASGLTKSGGGTLALEGTSINNYTGTTTINGGTLVVGKTGVIAIPGNVQIGDGSGLDILQLTADDQIADGATVTIGGSGQFNMNAFEDTIGTLAFNGGTVVSGGATLGITSGLTASAGASGTSASVDLSLASGVRTFDVVDGALAVDFELSGIISGAGGIDKTSGGTLALSGANTYTGTTTVTAGVLRALNSSALGGTGSGTTVVSGATLEVAGGVAIGAEALSLAGSGVGGVGAVQSSSGTNSIAGDVTLTAGTSIGVDAAALTLSGAIGDGGNVFGLTKLGAGTLALGGANANTYTGTTLLHTGSLTLSKTTGPAIAGAFVLNPSTTATYTASDQVGNASNITLGTGSTLDLAGFNDTVGALDLTAATINTGAGTLTIGGNVSTQASGTASNIMGNLAIGGVDRTFTTASTLQVGAVVGGAGGIIKAGTAALALNGANTYTGATAINVGTLRAGHSSALGETGSGTTVASGATLEFTASTAYASEPLSITGLGNASSGALAIIGAGIAASLTGVITLDGDSRIGVTQADSTLSIVSQVTDGASTFGITKTGSGRLELTNANPFNGAVDITAGTLAASNGGSMGTGAVSVSSNSTLEVSGNVTLANTSFAINGTGVSSAGAIRFLSGNNTINAGVTLGGNTAIVVDAGSSVISSVIAEVGGARALLKRGAGQLTLGGVNTFTGDLQVEAGEIELNGSIATDFVFNGGTLAGTGTIGNALRVNAGFNALSPGNSGDDTGTLTVTAGAVLDSNLTVTLDIDGTAAGQFDQLVVGEINLGNADLVVNVGFAATIGNTFLIVDNTGVAGVSGFFNSEGSPLGEGATFTSGNTTFSISYVGGTGNDVVLTVTDVTFVWDGGGGNNDWTTAANWVFDSAPTPGAKLEFPTGASRLTNTNNFPAGTDFHTITFSGAGYVIVGNRIDLVSGFVATHTTGRSEVHTNLELTANATVEVAAGGLLYMNNAISGGFGLTKQGAGELTLAGGSNANTFTGTTTVDAGTVVLYKDNSTDAIAGNLTVNAGTVRLASANQIHNSSAITLGAGTTLDLNGNDETIGALGMTGASVTTGAGLLTLGATVTTAASSTTSTIAGNVQHLANRIYNVADGAAAVDLQISAVMSGPGFSKQGAGLLELTGTNTTIASSTVTAGTLRVSNSSALGTALDDTSVSSGATVEIGPGLTVPETFSVTGTGNGSGVIQLVSGSSTLTGAITLTGDSTIGVPASSDLTIDGSIGGAFALTKAGVGYLVLNAANTYSGVTNINAGTVETGSTTALGTGDVTVASGATLSFNGFATTNPLFTISGTGIGGVGALLNYAGTNTINAVIDLAANATIGVTGGTSLDITSVIGVGGNARGLTKVGAGRLVLSGTPNYTGATTVSAGLLRIDGSIATSSGVTVDSGATLGGTGTVPATTVNGTLAPGSTLAGTLATGNSVWNAASAFAVDIDGAAQYDALSVTGSVVIDPTATLSIKLGYVPAIGATFTIIANDGTDSITGTFAGLGEGASIVVGNTTFQITYAGGSNNNDVVLTATDVSFVWDGGGGDNLWTTAANWVGDVAPVEGVNLVFPSGAARQTNNNDLTAGTPFHSIVIQASGYALGGNSIDLTNGITMAAPSSGSSISFDVELLGNQSIDVSASNILTLSGVISGGFTLTKSGSGEAILQATNTYSGGTSISGGTLEVDGATAALGSGAITIASLATMEVDSVAMTNAISVGGAGTSAAGAIIGVGGTTSTLWGAVTLTGNTSVATQGLGALTFNGVISGGFGLEILGGDGSVVLSGSGSNTYTGTTTIAGTTELFKSGGATAIAGNVIIAANTLWLLRPNQISDTSTVSLTSSSATLFMNNQSDTIASLQFTGGTVTTGAGTLTLNTSGTVVTTNAASTTATISGLLSLGGTPATFSIADGTTSNGIDLQVSAVVSGAGTLRKTGSGRLALSSANSYSGGTQHLQGEIRATNGASLGIGNGSIESTLELSGGITIANALTMNGGSPLVSNLSGDNTLTGTILLDNSMEASAAASTTLTFSGAVGNGSNGYGIAKSGAGTLRLMSDSTYTGGTEILAGTLAVHSTTATGTGGAVTASSGTTLRVATATYTLPSGGLLLDGATLLQGEASSSMVNGSITLLSGSTFAVVQTAGSMTIAGAITDGTSSFGFSKIGTGTLTLASANTYDGTTQITGGTLRIENAAALGSTSGGTVIGDNATLQTGLSSAAAIAEPLTVGTAGGTGTISASGFTPDFSGAVTLLGTLALTGTGTLEISGVIGDGSGSFGLTNNTVTTTLSGTNTFDGAVVIESGRVIIESTGALGSTSGSTELRSTGELQLALSGTNSIAEPIVVAASSTPLISNALGASTLTGAVGLRSNLSFNVTGNPLEIAGVVSQSGGNFGLIKLGGQNLILSAANTFDGVVEIQQGALIVRNPSALGGTTGGTVVHGSATLALDTDTTFNENLELGRSSVGGSLRNDAGDNRWNGTIILVGTNPIEVNGGSLLLNGVISGTGGITKTGTHAAHLNATNTYAGTTGVSSGVLNVTVSGGLSTAALDVATGGTVTLENGITITPSSITLRGDGDGNGALRSSSGNNAYAGPITLATASSIGVSTAMLTLSGAISGSGDLTKRGGGELVLSGSTGNSYTGTTTVVEGTLSLGKTSGAALGSGALTIGAGSGPDVVRLLGNDQIPDSVSVTVTEAGLFEVGSNSDAIGQLIIRGSNVTIDSGGVLGVTSVAFNAAFNTATGQLGGSGSLNFTQSIGQITVGDTPDAATDARIAATIRGSDITKAGTGVLALSGSNSFTGPMTVSAGILQVESDGALATTGAGTIVSASGSVEFIQSRTLSEAFQLSRNASRDSLRAVSGSTVLSGTVVLVGGVLIGAATGSSLRFDGMIDDPSNTSRLEINSSTTGTVILGNTNDLENGAVIRGGIVEIRADNALGASAPTSLNGGRVELYDASLVTGFSYSQSGTSIFNVEGDNSIAGNIMLGVDSGIEVASGTILTLQGQLVPPGSVNFFKSGAGGLVLEGESTGQFGLEVSAGTLVAGVQGALGLNGTVTLDPGTTLTLATAVVDLPAGGLIASGSTTINGGPSQLTGTISLLGDLTIAASTGNLVLGPITGAFDVDVQASTNRITLAGSSTYTGSTTVGSGELHVTGDISSSSGLTLAAGTILSGTGSLPGVVSTAATVHPGGSPGTLTVESLTLDASSTFDLDLDGTATSEYSRVISSGLVTLAGAALDVAFGYTPEPGDVLTIIDNTSGSPISGTFAGLPDGTIFARGGYTMQIQYDGGSGNDVTLTLLGVTTLDLTSNVSSAVFGQTVILTAEVSSDIGTPGGNVVFSMNSNPLPSGTVALQNVSGQWIATYSISTLTPGAYTFSADYAAGQVDDLLGSSDTLVPDPFLVGAAATTTRVGSSDPSTVYGESVTFTALVMVVAPGTGVPVGTVQFREGATVLGTSTLNSIGVATFTTSMLGASAEPHSITAYFSPTSFDWAPSDSSAAPFAQSVAKAMLTVTADDASRTYGAANPTLIAGYTGFVNGETLGTSGVTGSPSLTTAAVPTSPVNGSPFAIDAALGSLAATNYDFTFVSGELTITKAPLLVAADDTSRRYGEANPVFTASYSGFVNGETLDTSGVTGAPSLTTTAVPTSPVIAEPFYPITAVLGTLASNNYAFSFQDGQLAISRGVPNITLQASETLRYGQPTSLTATVLSAGAGQPTGTVSFFLGSTLLGTRTLDGSGSASLSIDSLPLGTHGVAAIYNGDVDFQSASSGSLAVDVSQAWTTTAISTSVVSSVFGQSVTITATVTPRSPSTSLPVTGSVSFAYDTEVLGVVALDSDGVATLTTSMLPVGTVELIATYISTPEFDTSEDREFFTINRANVSASITSSVNPADYGQPLSFTANLAAIAPGAGIPGGTIDFYFDNVYFGSAQLVGGEASINAPTLSVGGHTIEARYAGDGNFGPVIASLVQAIDASDVVVNAVSAGSTVFGQTAIFDVSVTPFYSGQAPSGFVTFWVEDVLIGQAMLDPMGEASFSTNALPVGPNVVTVLYLGDSRYVANDDTVTQVVASGQTTTTLTSSDPTSVFGQSVVFSVQVAPISPAAGMPAGQVVFSVDDTPLGIVSLDSNARAQITLSNLSVGTHRIAAEYIGNASFAGSSATPIQQVVSPGEAQVVITSSAPDAVFGQTFSLNVVMSGPVTPTGTVTFFDGSTSLGSSSLVDGQASIGVSNLSVGNHSITVVYSGDQNYAPFTSQPITQTIAKSGSTTTLTSSTSSPVFSQPVTFTAVLSAAAPGSGTPTGSVTFRDGSTVLATVPLVNGQARFTTSGLSLGAHQINATFNGSNDFNASTQAIETSIGQAASTVQVTSSSPTAVTGQTVTYSITAYAYTPATAEPTGTVTLFDGSTAIGTATLVGARAQISVVASGAVSTKTITVRYNGSAQFAGNTSPAISQIVNRAPTSTSIAVTQARRNGVNGYLFTMNAGSVAPGSGQPTGQVGFYARSTLYRSLDLVNGVATLFLSRSTAKQLGSKFAAMYNGDANFLTSVSPIIGLNGAPINGSRRPTRVFRGR